MSTIKERLGYRHEIPDLQLAHSKGNKIDAAYDRAKFIERTKMMQDWADYIEKISKGEKLWELMDGTNMMMHHGEWGIPKQNKK